MAGLRKKSKGWSKNKKVENKAKLGLWAGRQPEAKQFKAKQQNKGSENERHQRGRSYPPETPGQRQCSCWGHLCQPGMGGRA